MIIIIIITITKPKNKQRKNNRPHIWFQQNILGVHIWYSHENYGKKKSSEYFLLLQY